MLMTVDDGSGAVPLAPDAVAHALSQASGFLWIDVVMTSSSDPDVSDLLTSFGFTSAHAAYVHRTDISGTFTVIDGRIVVSTWLADDGSAAVTQVHIGWTPKWLLTVRMGGDRAISDVRRQLSASGAFHHPTTVLGIFLQLILGTVDDELIGYGEQVDTLDGQIIEDPHPSYLTQVRSLRSLILPMDRRFEPYAQRVSQALIDPTALPGMDAAGITHLQTYQARLHDTVARIADITDNLRDCAQDFQTEVGNRQGNRINQLTIVSILFLPVTFLTGYFGMNFQWLDNELLSMGSWLVLGVLLPIVTVFASAVVLSRRGYLRRRRQRASGESS